MRKPIDYQNFKASDFVSDPDFLQWILLPDESSDLFWREFMSRSPESEKEIQAAIRIVRSVRMNDYRFTDDQINEGIRRGKKFMDKEKRSRVLYRFVFPLSAAAALVAVVLLLNFLRPGVNLSSDLINPPTHTAGTDIQLVLADEETIMLGDGAEIKYDQNGDLSTQAQGNQQKIAHANKDNEKLNTLIVPKGKRSYLTLSDGSKIWVNAGTKLEFPSMFSQHKREIKVDGEVFLEVAKDEKRPFYVLGNDFSIQVLGTSFNVSNYGSDKMFSVVLVEGSVTVNSDKTSTKLHPNQMLTVADGLWKTKEVDVSLYTSWKEGQLIFSGEPLGNILLKLNRYYNVPFEVTTDIRDIQCTGKLVLFDDWEIVLKNISMIIPLQYEKKNELVFLSKRAEK